MDQVVRVGMAVDQDIVKEYDCALAKHWGKCFIHHSLESTRCARQTKRHHIKLAIATMCVKSCLVLLTRRQPDLMVTSMEIQLGEPRGSGEFIQEFVDHRKWVLRLDREHVKVAVINTQSPSEIMFAHHNDW
jgi:hypothetical protein